MDKEHGAAQPSWAKKLLYLAGIRAPAQDRHWVAGIIHDTAARRRGLLLALPNVTIMAVFGVLSLATSTNSTFTIITFCGALGTAAVGFISQSIESRRTRWLARRNGIA